MIREKVEPGFPNRSCSTAIPCAAVNRTLRNFHRAGKNRSLSSATTASLGGMPVSQSEYVMSETATTQPKPKTTQNGSNDGRVLAQVDKWLETIREISREPAKS